ncbi:hypothetical protein [Pedobacter sp.]|uniref:hypothetical protein n=1 Tax=Pedobacter sp. TaxID=1411316 RepID=UPI0031D9B26A
MAMILLYSNCLISFEKLSQFLTDSNIILKGFLDIEDVKSIYRSPVISEIDFANKIKNLQGLTLIGEFNFRELPVSFFQSKKEGLEVMVFLDSLDHFQREPIKANLQNTFNKHNLFQMIVCDDDDESNDCDWPAEFEEIMVKMPESVSSFCIRR